MPNIKNNLCIAQISLTGKLQQCSSYSRIAALQIMTANEGTKILVGYIYVL